MGNLLKKERFNDIDKTVSYFWILKSMKTGDRVMKGLFSNGDSE